MSNGADPLDFFQLFFNDAMWSFLLTEALNYSGNVILTGELKATFGVLLASGVSQLPKRQDYWSTNDVL